MSGFSWWRYWISLLHAMVLQKLLAVLDELEILKPQVRRQLDEMEKVSTTHMNQFDGPNKISYASSVNNKDSLTYSNKQVLTKIKCLIHIFFLLLTLYFFRCCNPLQYLHLLWSRIMSILDFRQRIPLSLNSRRCECTMKILYVSC